MVKTKKLVCGGVGGAIVLLGVALVVLSLVFLYVLFPNIVQNGVKDGKYFGKNADGTWNTFTTTWAYPNYISTIQYYSFDYLNTVGIQNRAIYPDMLEKGPYAYDEKIINSAITFSSDQTEMNFQQATQYYFNPNKSCSTCDPYKDMVTIPDISFIIAVQQLEIALKGLFDLLYTDCEKLNLNDNVCNRIPNIEEEIHHEIGNIFSVLGEGPFVTVTVDQLIFSGYNSPIIVKVNQIIDFINELVGKAVLSHVPNIPVNLNTENGTTDWEYTVLTGSTDYEKAGYIQSFKGVRDNAPSSAGNTLPSEWWPSAYKGSCTGKNGARALSIDGTNGDFFKAYLKATETVPLYIDDLCRTIHLQYDRDVTVQGIDGLRFVIPPSEFNYTYPENCGFCVPLKYGAYDYPAGSPCMPPGVFDLSGCQQGAPLLLSKPHFYQADPIIQQFVPRFKSNYDTDETTLDIEPYTGTVLSAAKKIQINLFLNQFPEIKTYNVMRPGAYPLLWQNETFFMDAGTKSQLNSQLFGPMNIVTIVCWVLFGVGCALMAIGALMLGCQFIPDKNEKEL